MRRLRGGEDEHKLPLSCSSFPLLLFAFALYIPFSSSQSTNPEDSTLTLYRGDTTLNGRMLNAELPCSSPLLNPLPPLHHRFQPHLVYGTGT
jgi:hypothetical protein